MAKRERRRIEIQTEQGPAEAAPQPNAVADDEWLLSTPWQDRTFFGSRGQARAELTRMARAGEAVEAQADEDEGGTATEG
jgi:hypothetical protein